MKSIKESKRVETLVKRKLKRIITQSLQSTYVLNHSGNKEIDSYNYGIHDSIEKIKNAF